MNTIERAARDAVPTLADFCLVHVVKGAAIPCVACLHVSRDRHRDVRALMRAHVIRLDDPISAVAHVLRTHRPLLRTRIPEEPQDPRAGGRITRLHWRLAPRSVLVVPIVTGGAVVGALSLCYSDSGRSHAPRHVLPARRIAARIGHALMPGDADSSSGGMARRYISCTPGTRGAHASAANERRATGIRRNRRA